MRIVAISDLHFKKGYDDKLNSLTQTIGKADLVLIAGDLTHFGAEAELDTILSILSNVSTNIYAVPGNCDTIAVAESLKARGVSLEGKAAIADECLINGLGGVPQWRKVDYGFTEEELLQTLNQGADSAMALLNERPGGYIRILLTHVPPYGSKADRAMFMKHVGSKAVAEHIEQNQYDLCICGHIHECVGVSMFNDVPLINCGPARRGYYVIINIESETNDQLKVNIESKRDGSRYWL